MPDPAMKESMFLIFRLICMAGLILTLAAGFYLSRHRQALFGTDPGDPSENSSARSYNTMQVLAIWAHLVVFFTLGVLLLH
jgi:hypothetical protein